MEGTSIRISIVPEKADFFTFIFLLGPEKADLLHKEVNLQPYFLE